MVNFDMFGKVVRFNNITIKTKNYKEKGGVQETSTDTRIKESAERVVEQYPLLCSINDKK